MKRFVKTLLHNLLLAFLAFVWLVPIVWLVVTSFSAYTGMNTSTFFPKEWSLAQYKNLLFSADSANISLGMRSALRFLAANYYIMFCGASSSNYCTKRQRFYPLPLFFALKRAETPFSFYRQQTAGLPPIQRCAAGGENSC